MTDAPSPYNVPEPRLSRPNWAGLCTLIEREVGRFMSVYMQTLVAPLVTLVLYYAVFAVIQRGTVMPGGIGYLTFLAPGLIMMSMAQNAFANTSSSIIIAKMQGTMVDLLMPPLSTGNLLTGLVIGGVARGMMVGAVCVPIMAFVIHWKQAEIGALLLYGIEGCILMATLGVLTGLWSEKFDHTAAITNFVVTPLTFLSGTFYALDQLPDFWQKVAHANPFFYMIDGFRYGLTGFAESPLLIGALVLTAVNAILLAFTYYLLHKGYKILS
jgi:ABC-2 type transport system permease protein